MVRGVVVPFPPSSPVRALPETCAGRAQAHAAVEAVAALPVARAEPTDAAPGRVLAGAQRPSLAARVLDAPATKRHRAVHITSMDKGDRHGASAPAYGHGPRGRTARAFAGQQLRWRSTPAARARRWMPVSPTPWPLMSARGFGRARSRTSGGDCDLSARLAPGEMRGP